MNNETRGGYPWPPYVRIWGNYPTPSTWTRGESTRSYYDKRIWRRVPAPYDDIVEAISLYELRIKASPHVFKSKYD